MGDLTPVGETLVAYARTLTANIERAARRDITPEELDRVISPAEIRLAEAMDRIGLEYVQQHPIGQYDADFYLPAARLVVEVDGRHHRDIGRPERDRRRDERLAEKGIYTYRIEANLVGLDADGCARAIRALVDRRQIDAMGGS